MNETKCAPAEYLVCELLDALKMAVRVIQDCGADEAMAGEFEILTDAIARAEQPAVQYGEAAAQSQALESLRELCGLIKAGDFQAAEDWVDGNFLTLLPID